MQIRDSEKGSVLIVAIIISGLLFVIGTAITMTATIELKTARNEKVAQTAFYRAENGRVLAAGIVRSVFSGSSYSDGAEYEPGSNVFVMDGDFPFESIDDNDNYSDTTRDISMSGSLEANVDVDKVSVEPLPGGSAEFASGHEGIGKAGSAQVIYEIESEGRAAANSRSLVEVQYRMLP
jgi:hypothetical protein